MNVNRVSTIFHPAWWTLNVLCIAVDTWTMHRPPPRAKMLVIILLTATKNECQWSLNYFILCILDNPMAMERCYPIIKVSASLTGKNGADDIAAASYNWVSTKHQQCSWGLSRLHSNNLHSIVTELSLTQSVLSICPWIQLHIYACNVSQIWFFCLSLYSHCWRIRSLLGRIFTFVSLSSWITKLSNSCHPVGFKI